MYGIQKNPTQYKWTSSSNAYGHLIIDDIALGIPTIFDFDTNREFVDWNMVEKMLTDKGIIK